MSSLPIEAMAPFFIGRKKAAPPITSAPVLTVSASSNGFAASWTAVNNATYYIVQWRVGNSGNWSNRFQSGIAYLATGLLWNTSYQVRVAGRNADHQGPWSTIKSVSTAPFDLNVQLSNINYSFNRATVTFNDSAPGANSYRASLVFSQGNSNRRDIIVENIASGTTVQISNPNHSATDAVVYLYAFSASSSVGLLPANALYEDEHYYYRY